jgi:nucleoside 2-deoxyribosyltransferase
MKIYLAGPLFSLSEQQFNKELATGLEKTISGCSVLLPQEFSKKITSKTDYCLSDLFYCCLNLIDEADMILAILEGPDADSGTCIELGYAYSKKKPIIGIRTDFRSSEDKGVNLMVSNVCAELIRDTTIESMEELIYKVDTVISKMTQIDKLLHPANLLL